eukprot:gnl/TRDRNA2_/TRDRNA2_42543_c0_seq1.p1 gnl/TRDRNA2_/TRDRNA2_42543_c0~~gnl/TRDRNA2_/TRDRNA2_42543_c0_seq1.p1  ORF type:complete len:192 (-),score=30.47 gnl/TRDRNA2_/TRDRNA2_42543_c0_seq1:204-779(-)
MVEVLVGVPVLGFVAGLPSGLLLVKKPSRAKFLLTYAFGLGTTAALLNCSEHLRVIYRRGARGAKEVGVENDTTGLDDRSKKADDNATVVANGTHENIPATGLSKENMQDEEFKVGVQSGKHLHASGTVTSDPVNMKRVSEDMVIALNFAAFWTVPFALGAGFGGVVRILSSAGLRRCDALARAFVGSKAK